MTYPTVAVHVGISPRLEERNQMRWSCTMSWELQMEMSRNMGMEIEDQLESLVLTHIQDQVIDDFPRDTL